MSCEESLGLLDGYVDGELDAGQTLAFEGHLPNCPRCSALCEEWQELRHAVKTHGYFFAPEGLENRIRVRLRDARIPAVNRPFRNPFSVGWRLSAVAASIVALLVSSALFFEVLQRPSPTEILARDVLSSHIRSLIANHLTDVASSDHHTVKPWFSGKLDFAPPVKDIGDKGFPLTGGRLDYLDGRTVAALLYKRHQHIISLFLWPSSQSDSRPRTLTMRGYSLVHWTESGMTCWAVSDLNARELMDFVHDQKQ